MLLSVGLPTPRRLSKATASCRRPVSPKQPPGTAPEPPRTSKLPRRVLAALLSLALVLGVVAAANGLASLRQQSVKAKDSTAAITGTSVFKAKQLGIKAKVVGGPLLPGVTRTLRVNLANKMSKPLLVSGVTVKVKKPPAAGCLPSWVTAKPFKATKKQPADHRQAPTQGVGAAAHHPQEPQDG